MSGLIFTMSDATSFLPDNLFGLKMKLYSGLRSCNAEDVDTISSIPSEWLLCVQVSSGVQGQIQKMKQETKPNNIHLHV